MVPTLLPFWFHFSSVTLLFISLVFASLWLFLPVFFVYFLAVFFFRKSSLNSDLLVTRETNFYAPVTGMVQSVEKMDDHCKLHGRYNVVRLMIPFWESPEFRLAHSAEVVEVIRQWGRSYFRFKPKSLRSQKEKILDGLFVSFRADDELWGMHLLKCEVGLRPVFNILTGDRGKVGAAVGHMLFGGTVLLYIPEKYEILVSPGDKIHGNQSVIASSDGERDESSNGRD